MPVLLRIALRNLKEHKSKSLIVGVIIALGIAVLVTGNSMMDTAIKGIETMFIDNYSGHIMITGPAEGDLSLFGFTTPDQINDTVPIIPDYEKVMDYVQSNPLVEGATPQISSRVLVSEEESFSAYLMLFGIEPASYRDLFNHNIELISGRFLRPQEDGLVLSEQAYKDIKENSGRDIKPGDSLLLTSIGGVTGLKIREVPVRGIFRFINSNNMLDRVSFIDVENHRALAGLVVGTAADLDVPKEELEIGSLSEDALFGGSGGDGIVVQKPGGTQAFSEQSLMQVLGDKTAKESLLKTDSGAWHYILVKLKNGGDLEKAITQFREYFKSQGINVKVSDWLASAGVLGTIAYAVEVLFIIIVLIVSVVAVIIIMNTLVVSILERTSEIGTMRAMGAQKGFVWKLILIETVVISVVFGLIGILLGLAVLGFLNLLHLEAPNTFYQLIYGGQVLSPAVSLPALGLALVIIAAVGVLASLYPVAVALKIEPIRAIQKN